MNRRPQLRLIAPGATPQEAAAVVAAIERFVRDSAPVISAAPTGPSGWQRAALQEAVRQAPELPAPWT